MNRRTFIKITTITLLPASLLAKKEVKPTQPLKWIALTEQVPKPGQRIIMVSRRRWTKDDCTLFVGTVYDHKKIAHKLGGLPPNFALDQSFRVYKDSKTILFLYPKRKHSLRDIKRVDWTKADEERVVGKLNKKNVSMFWSFDDMYWIKDTGTLPKTLPLIPDRILTKPLITAMQRSKPLRTIKPDEIRVSCMEANKDNNCYGIEPNFSKHYKRKIKSWKM